MKVTEKNMATVMGHINRFLSKDTREYVGLKKYQVGTQILKTAYGDFQVPLFEERETYQPFVGKCTVHHIRREVEKKLKENKVVWPSEKYQYHKVLLAITDNYHFHCLPIEVGFDISIKGNVMIIKENNVMSKHMSFDGKIHSFKMKDRSTYHYFYHMPISETEKREKVREAIRSLEDWCDQHYYCADLSECYPDWMVWNIRTLHSDLSEQISFAIDGININASEVDINLHVDDSIINKKKDIKLHINIDMLRNGVVFNDDAYYFTCDSKKYSDLLLLIEQGILAEEMEKRTKELSSEQNFDFDIFDYDDYDF